jgi:peptidyl-prolyl cis-trans isomerase C
MTFKPARLLFALIAVVAVPSFAQNVAVVNGKAIPSSRVDAVVKQVVAQGQQPDSPQLREMIKKDLVAREVMMQQALKMGFEKDPTVKQQLEAARQQIVVNALAREFVTKNPTKDDEIKAEYEAYKKEVGDKEYHIRHILVDTEADAKAMIAKLKGGAKFEELAKQSKDQGSAGNGGDLDWMSPGMLPKPFADAVISLQKGAVTETPVQTPNGFHVIKVDDTRAAKVMSLDEAKPQISEMIQRKKLAAYQDSLVKKAVIK